MELINNRKGGKKKVKNRKGYSIIYINTKILKSEQKKKKGIRKFNETK